MTPRTSSFLFATWTALSLWQDDLRDSFLCFYLDNEAAKGAFIACKSSTGMDLR